MIVDASSIVAWLFNEGGQAPAIGRLIAAQATLVAPTVWKLEILNVVAMKLRKGHLTVDEAESLAEAIDELSVTLIDPFASASAAEIVRFAHNDRLTTYDAAYVRLAQIEQLPLLSFDREVVVAARRLGIRVIDQVAP